MVKLINADGSPMVQPSRSSRVRPSASSTAYAAADRTSQDLANWNVTGASADADLLGERDTIVARVRDLVRNNGWASGSVRRELDNVIGSELRLSAKADYRALGLSSEWAVQFNRQVEGLWRLYASDPACYCDAARHENMGGILGQAYRHYIVDGEALAILLWLPERGGRFATTVQMVDPDRLSNPGMRMDDDRLRSGVEIDQYGAAVGYHIRKRHPYDIPALGAASFDWERVARDTSWGRPITLHFYEKERAGQTRGVGRLTPVLERLKMLDKYDRAELDAAVLNAIFAAFIESPMDHEMIQEMLEVGDNKGLGNYQDGRTQFHEERLVNLNGTRIPTLYPGEKFQFQPSARPNTAFPDFEAAALRNIAAGIGISYEQLTQDWSKVNYSSARAALLETWKTLITRRAAFARGFASQIYLAFLEEVIDSGEVTLPPGAPGFQEARAAYGRCKWIGPGRGWVDPVKEKQGAILGIAAGLSTLEDEAAEQGKDYEEILDQLEVEISRMPAGVMHPAQGDYLKLMQVIASQQSSEKGEDNENAA